MPRNTDACHNYKAIEKKKQVLIINILLKYCNVGLNSKHTENMDYITDQ